ncbi:helix-turn-helix domain-containing protein [Haladaptatus pallidirubidus]|uniref:helix-turn-helix domain-containing protein n=1 Tax=Haladaptatus pallidirubidus TaxID=1008152 RepID=UPI001D12F648|nr:helix-turn-helix domain-containing protein [Haladaptatus pallidirubidus]
MSEITSLSDQPFNVTQEEVRDDYFITFVIEAGEEQTLLKEKLVASEQVKSVEALDESRLLVTKKSCGALPIIRQNHGMLDGMDKVNGSQRIFDIVVFRREDLKRIIAELSEIGSVSLGKLSPFESQSRLLSSRQAEVIELALVSGYFDWPRKIEAQDLASELDIAHPTFLEHLRKAEKKLLIDALEKKTQSATAPAERKFILNNSI